MLHIEMGALQARAAEMRSEAERAAADRAHASADEAPDAAAAGAAGRRASGRGGKGPPAGKKGRKPSPREALAAEAAGESPRSNMSSPWGTDVRDGCPHASSKPCHARCIAELDVDGSAITAARCPPVDELLSGPLPS